MHSDQLTVTAATVRELVARQFPRWAGLAVTQVGTQGTDNALFRVGDRLVARFPLRPGEPAPARRDMEAEADAARELLGRTRFPTPEPVALGEPGAGYPMPWSVQTWIPGTVATPDEPGTSPQFAHDLAEFIRGVRAIDVRGRTFTGSGRGGDLHDHDAWMEDCFARSEGLLDVTAARRLWRQMRDLPRAGPDVMTHGDLIPGNVLVSGGRLAGILDVGGLGPADPALDLVCAWHLLGAGPRQVLRTALACGDLEWARGRAWAFEQAMGAFWYYVRTNPAMSRMGERTVQRVMASPG